MFCDSFEIVIDNETRTFENSDMLFNDILELTDKEKHEIIIDSFGKIADKTTNADIVVGYTIEKNGMIVTNIFENKTIAKRHDFKKCKKCNKYYNEKNIKKIGTQNICEMCDKK